MRLYNFMRVFHKQSVNFMRAFSMFVYNFM